MTDTELHAAIARELAAAEVERNAWPFCATPGEACREYAYNAGADQPDREWLLTDYDTWERNPHYTGPKGPHPEEDLPC